jgi:hypothetical protein
MISVGSGCQNRREYHKNITIDTNMYFNLNQGVDDNKSRKECNFNHMYTNCTNTNKIKLFSELFKVVNIDESYIHVKRNKGSYSCRKQISGKSAHNDYIPKQGHPRAYNKHVNDHIYSKPNDNIHLGQNNPVTVPKPGNMRCISNTSWSMPNIKKQCKAKIISNTTRLSPLTSQNYYEILANNSGEITETGDQMGNNPNNSSPLEGTTTFTGKIVQAGGTISSHMSDGTITLHVKCTSTTTIPQTKALNNKLKRHTRWDTHPTTNARCIVDKLTYIHTNTPISSKAVNTRAHNGLSTSNARPTPDDKKACSTMNSVQRDDFITDIPMGATTLHAVITDSTIITPTQASNRKTRSYTRWDTPPTTKAGIIAYGINNVDIIIPILSETDIKLGSHNGPSTSVISPSPDGTNAFSALNSLHIDGTTAISTNIPVGTTTLHVTNTDATIIAPTQTSNKKTKRHTRWDTPPTTNARIIADRFINECNNTEITTNTIMNMGPKNGSKSRKIGKRPKRGFKYGIKKCK